MLSRKSKVRRGVVLLRYQIFVAIIVAVAPNVSFGAQRKSDIESRHLEKDNVHRYAGQCDDSGRDFQSKKIQRYGDDRDFECFIFDEY